MAKGKTASAFDKMLQSDAMAKLVVRMLPKLEPDGNPVTECPARGVFRRVLTELAFPPMIESTAREYLERASDVQLAVIVETVHALSDALVAAEDRAALPVSAPLALMS